MRQEELEQAKDSTQMYSSRLEGDKTIQLRMCAMMEDERGVQVGFVDTQSGATLFLGTGERRNDIELLSADYDREEAVIRHRGEMILLKLQEDASSRLAPPDYREWLANPSSPTQSGPPVGTRRAKTVSVEDEITREEVSRRMRAYQMDMIRQGLPSVPVPLTREMDDQLVREGFLPAIEE